MYVIDRKQMKKYTKVVMTALVIILSAFSVNARSAGDEITNKGYAFVIDNNNANVVLHPGLTAGQWKNVMERFCQMKFGKILQTVLSGSTVEDKSKSNYILYNTYWYGGQAKSFGPDKIERDVLVYNGQPWLVVRCAQLVSTDRGMIDNAIKGIAPPPPAPKPEIDTTKKEQIDKNDSMQKVEVTFKGLESAAQQTNSGWLPALIILAILAIIALVIIALVARDNRKNTQQGLIAEQNNFIDQHYANISKFHAAARTMNTENAVNARDVHNTWTNVNHRGQ